MNGMITCLRAASELLERLRRRFCLVGGLAVSARSEPRFTRDVDLAVAISDDKDAEALVATFASHGYRVHTVVEQEAAERLATVRLSPAGQGEQHALLDLLFASSGIEPEVAADAEPIELVEGLTIPVARLGHLLALKLLARDDQRRPQDAVDLHALMAHASPRELDRAREAVALIAARGFGRGRDLASMLTALMGG